MNIEILLVQPDFERLLSPYIENLKRAGISAALRIVDTSQYENRTDNFEFDMINIRFNFFPPPGAELRSFYGSKGADEPGTANMAGIRVDAVDKIVEQVISAPDLDTLKVYTRALDRILLFGHYIIPQWHNAHYRIAYWNRFARPERAATYGTGFPKLGGLMNRWTPSSLKSSDDSLDEGRPSTKLVDKAQACLTCHDRIHYPPLSTDGADAVRHHGAQLRHCAVCTWRSYRTVAR